MDTNMFSRYWQLVGGSQRYSFDSFVGTQQYAIQQARINYREKICLLELIQTLMSSGAGQLSRMKNGYQARTIYLSTMGQDPA